VVTEGGPIEIGNGRLSGADRDAIAKNSVAVGAVIAAAAVPRELDVARVLCDSGQAGRRRSERCRAGGAGQSNDQRDKRQGDKRGLRA
jgi:hypothetical protein